MNTDKVRQACCKALRTCLADDLPPGAAIALETACWDRACVVTKTAKSGGQNGAGDTLSYDKSEVLLSTYIQACMNATANIAGNPRLSNGNRYLKDALAAGRIDVSDVPASTAHELNPTVHRAAPSKCITSGVDDARATDMFECPRCTKRKCVHYELQTRSADEATTVFVTCVACGHRWTE